MRRVVYWLAMVLAATAVAGGVTYAYVGYRETSGPNGAVRGYLSALARGDATGALAFAVTPSGDRAYLTDDVLAMQLAIAPMKSIHVETASTEGDRASVLFSYVLGFASGDQNFSGTLDVVDSNDGWRLTSAAVAVRISAEQAVDRFAFAGTAVPDGAVLLFPGALPVRFDTRYLQTDPADPSVAFGRSGRIELRIEPTAAARAALTAQVRRRLVACVTSSRAAGDCPLPSPRFLPGSLHGRIGAVRLSFRVSSAAAGPISITGSAVFVGRARELRYDNTVVMRSGRLALPIDASAYPVAPLAVRFGTGE